jgi:hypothetical protein
MQRLPSIEDCVATQTQRLLIEAPRATNRAVFCALRRKAKVAH